MGYTNYWEWKDKVTRKEWEAILKDCRKAYRRLPQLTGAYDHAGVVSCNSNPNTPLFLSGCGASQHPKFGIKGIYFNGSKIPPEERVEKTNTEGEKYWEGDEMSHETFCLNLNSDSWNFCKTARKPYDIMVKACLLITQHHVGAERFKASCDGDDEDWTPATRLIVTALGNDYLSPELVEKLL